ncbi:NERD domain-containing protein [Streptomyces sp. ISL-90]|nr:NERD domain-containing protein [Streptomyces sp. ISL-90]
MIDLRARPPAASVIAECLARQAEAGRLPSLGRFLGASPLTEESRPWYVGALGELEVARRLEKLDATWTVLHSVPIGAGTSDIDHVVIGPGGVFTINTKFHEGKDVWVGSKRILVGGQRTDHLRNARFEANRAARCLSTASGMPVSVTPIIGFVGTGRITVRDRSVDVVILRERELVWWLRRRRPALKAEAVAQLVDTATDAATWHRAPTLAAVDLVAFGALQREVRGAKRRRVAWAFGGLAAVAAAVSIAWAPVMTAVGL